MNEPADNPYESPRTTAPRMAGIPLWLSRIIGGTIMVVFLTGSVVQILGFAFTPLQHFLMPRFGWGGLMMCLNAAIFLGMWLKTPTRRLLSVAAGMCVFLASMESVQLYWKGTVPVVSNPFHDRLHSSWAWSVAPLLVSAVILVWLARSQRDESVDDSVTAK